MNFVLVGLSLLVVVTKQEDVEISSTVGQLRYCLRNSDVLPCVKRLIARNLQQAVESDAVWPITDYLSITKDRDWRADITNNSKVLTPDEQIVQGVHDFVRSRSLQVKFVADDAEMEGRKKKDKNGGMMMMAGLAMAGMMGQMFMGKIAFLAGTALMISKLALLLSSLIGLKKLVGSGGGGGEHVVYASADHGHGGWQRSYDSNSHLLSYSAHAPAYQDAREEQEALSGA
ncbi:uncharacterized protein LOC113375360 [Ctenocephalides felis]|uniref:uncharacterized protein LOC113375360 n=1 Tax=Ctenocephalides felis TaxID=7515 RepID=UPI000E6E256F|nr:uncharacterized protein LOC113375360 [Ctenocephalides felis]